MPVETNGEASHVGELIARMRRNGDREAFFWRGRSLRYADLCAIVERWEEHLGEAKIVARLPELKAALAPLLGGKREVRVAVTGKAVGFGLFEILFVFWLRQSAFFDAYLGLNADVGAAPDAHLLSDYLVESYVELRDAAGVEPE